MLIFIDLCGFAFAGIWFYENTFASSWSNAVDMCNIKIKHIFIELFYVLSNEEFKSRYFILMMGIIWLKNLRVEESAFWVEMAVLFSYLCEAKRMVGYLISFAGIPDLVPNEQLFWNPSKAGT